MRSGMQNYHLIESVIDKSDQVKKVELILNPQTGQATVESLLGIASLITLFVCIGQLGAVQYETMKLQALSHKQAFLVSRASVSSGSHQQNGNHELMNFAVIEQPISPINSLGIGSFEIIAVKVQQRTWADLVSLRKIAYLARSDSHCSSAQHMHHRIKADPILWGRASEASQVSFRKFAHQLGTIDDPWRRHRPSGEWLSDWEDVTPASATAFKSELTHVNR